MTIQEGTTVVSNPASIPRVDRGAVLSRRICFQNSWSWFRLSRWAGLGLALATLGFGGCAQQPRQFAAASHGSEYFPSSKYGPASRRVVADGAPIPHGGGQYLVGRPYTVAGQTYYPSERRIVQVGTASWYGDAFHGRLTANGEIYDKNSFTAAHPTMPLPSYARVTNLRNNSSMIVRVNDRGPYASNRVMDVSGRVAEALDFKRYGTAKIKVEYVGRASLAGSEDARLFATLRVNEPAPWQAEPMAIAAAAPPARVASLAPYVPQTRRAPEQPPRTMGEERERAVSRRAERREPRADREDRRTEAAAETARRERPRIVQNSPARGSAILPPSRPMDLGTIRGAAARISARRRLVADTGGSRPDGLRLARQRDD